MKLQITPEAANDLEAITLHIAEENPMAALAVADAIERRLQQLVRHPYSGPPREDIGPGVRHLVSGKYIAFYRVISDVVEVLRILHGKKRIETESIG